MKAPINIGRPIVVANVNPSRWAFTKRVVTATNFHTFLNKGDSGSNPDDYRKIIVV